jgi:hypothetical protein
VVEANLPASGKTLTTQGGRTMTLLLSSDEVERLLDKGDCIEQLERAYPELGDGIGVSRTVSAPCATALTGA